MSWSRWRQGQYKDLVDIVMISVKVKQSSRWRCNNGTTVMMTSLIWWISLWRCRSDVLSDGNSNEDLSCAKMMISTMTKKRIGVLVLEWLSKSRVMVLVFFNWNLYKNNFVRVFLSKRESFWPWKKAKILCSCLFVFW